MGLKVEVEEEMWLKVRVDVKVEVGVEVEVEALKSQDLCNIWDINEGFPSILVHCLFFLGL